MKKILFLAAMMLLAVSANGMNQFSFSDNDSVRIHPNRLDGYTQQVVTMTTDAYCDSWNIDFGYPSGLTVKLVAGVTPMGGMTVDYLTATGDMTTYQAVLNVSAVYGSISSTTSTAYGFWEYAGQYIPYGTVKWSPDTREMFSMNLYVDPKFRTGDIVMDCVFNSSMDSRGPILSNVRCYKVTHVWVGYRKGDLNGDDKVNISDVTMLINAVLTDGELDEFQYPAADYNGDGEVNITDATLIMNHIINNA